MLGEMLMQLRKKHGLSQQEVADRLGVSRQTISNWECGLAAPALDKAAELAALYEVSLDELAAAVVWQSAGQGGEKGPDLHLLQDLQGRVCTVTYVDEKAAAKETRPKRVRVLAVEEGALRCEMLDEEMLVAGVWEQTIETAAVQYFVIE